MIYTSTQCDYNGLKGDVLVLKGGDNMKSKNNKLGISIEYAIKESNKFKNDEYLQYLFSNLKEETLLITIDNKCEPTIFEDSDHSIPIINRDNRPTIIMSLDYKFWFSCFTKESDIPAEFKEIYEVKKIKFKDLVQICIESNDISGISINHKSTNGIRISKKILKFIITGI